MEVLTIQGLTKHYPSFTLDQASFTVRSGEIMGFIGRNGAGKTTALKALMNIIHPDAGDITFFGLTFSEHELAVKQRVGFVSGGVDFYPRSKLKTITDIARRFYPTWDDAAYQHYLSLFALEENKTPMQLSAGMKVKYNLALALSHHAELLLLDEPTSGLDPVSRDELLDVFIALAKAGTSILFSTHITGDLDQCADRITYIRHGKIVASEAINTFRERYRSVHLPDGAISPSLGKKLIGCKPAKEGSTAIILAEDAQALGLDSAPTDLNTIMIHMEKE